MTIYTTGYLKVRYLKVPDQATWDDIMYEFYVKKKLANALKAVEEGRVVSHEEVKKRLLSE